MNYKRYALEQLPHALKAAYNAVVRVDIQNIQCSLFVGNGNIC